MNLFTTDLKTESDNWRSINKIGFLYVQTGSIGEFQNRCS